MFVWAGCRHSLLRLAVSAQSSCVGCLLALDTSSKYRSIPVKSPISNPLTHHDASRYSRIRKLFRVTASYAITLWYGEEHKTSLAPA